MADVITELTILHEQVAHLEKYFEKQGTQFASLDDFSHHAADQKVEELDAQLETLNHDIQGLIDGQHAPAKHNIVALSIQIRQSMASCTVTF